MSKNAKPKTINQKIADLQNRVDWFHSDDFDLDQATKHYKDTVALAHEITKDLDNLKNEITVISKDFSR